MPTQPPRISIAQAPHHPARGSPVSTFPVPDDPFAGEGEMRALCRAFDWASTPLGPVREWPPTLRGAVRSVMESPFVMALFCGPERVFIYNDAYRRLLGIKHPKALGQPIREPWSEVWDEVEPMFEQIESGGPPIYAEDVPYFVWTDDGAVGVEPKSAEPNIWVTFSLSGVRDAAGELVAILNVVCETTDRIKAERAQERALHAAEYVEARMRAIFAQAPAFVAVLRGPEHVFEFVNEGYYQLVGHRPLIGRPLAEVLPELSAQGLDKLLDQVLETGTPYIGREMPVELTRSVGAAPELHYQDFVYYPLIDIDGTRSGVVVYGSDITDYVLAKRAALEARAEAEEANEAKSRFLAMMSHEIRTPINAVVGYADLLDAGIAGPLNGQQKEYVERIRASSAHLMGLINDVLDLAKLEAEEMRVHRSEVAVRAVMLPALQMITPQAEARELELHEVFACDPSTRFLGDEDRARQVLVNLLGNAAKFTEPGGRITLRCRCSEPGEDAAAPREARWVVLEVEDTGRGIPADQLEKIFEPFVQGDGGHTRQTSGTGLGLTISRRFARLMDGDLTVRSEVGVGSCFSLWLPIAAGSPC